MARFAKVAETTASATDFRRRIGALASPADSPRLFGSLSLEDEIKSLEPADVRVVYPDAASLAAFGTNPVSPSTRTPAAQTGRNIGRTRAADLEWFAT
jgi:NTE family protein